MIMLAKVVPYGGNAVRYALEKEKAKLVKVNHMPEGIDPTAIWYMMKHHSQLHQQDRTVGRALERLMVQFVISPSKEEVANFTMNDWANLHDESLETMDSLGLIPKGMKKEVKTNFRNSMNVGGLHSDSKSGTLHLHMDCCRVDLDGNTNDVHDIHKRAMMAAEIINMQHGWKQPKEIREMRKKEIKDFCEYTLQKMDAFDIDRYFNLLRMKGYEVTPRYDKNKKFVGYTIGKNASVFKASEIGRRYMASQLEASWEKLHPAPTQVKVKPASPTVIPSNRPTRPVTPKPTFTQTKVQPSVQPKPTPAKTVFNIDTGSEVKKVWISDSVKDIFLNKAQVPEGNDTATVENIAHTAMFLFAGYIDAATTMSESCGGGGGSAPESDFDNMMNEVEEDIQEQDAEQDIVNRVPELKHLSTDIDKATTAVINAKLSLESSIHQTQREEGVLGATVNTISNKVDTINEHIDQVMEDAPTKLKVTVTVCDDDWQKMHELHDQWMEQEKQMLADQHKQQETLWLKQSQRLTGIVKNNKGVWMSEKVFYIIGSLSLLSIITIAMEIVFYVYFKWIA